MKEGTDQHESRREELSHPVEHWGEELRSYVLNTEIGEEGMESVHKVQETLQKFFPDSFLIAPDSGIHITLMDWVAPLVSYKEDKDKLFEQHFTSYNITLENILINQKPITVRFNQVWVSPDAVIVVGRDDGSYSRIRSEFLDRESLIEGTKLPPKIIHSTIARFSKPVSMEEVREVLDKNPIDFTQEVDHFRLIKESRIPMLEFEELKRYELTGQ